MLKLRQAIHWGLRQRRSPGLRLLMIAVLTLSYGWLLKHKILSIKEVGMIFMMGLGAGVIMKYYQRKLAGKLKKQAKDKLSEQAKRFHGELWKVIHKGPWADDEIERLMDLQDEFRQIHPADRYDTTNPKYFLWKQSKVEDLTESEDRAAYQ